MTLARPSRAQVEAGTGPPGVESYPGSTYTCIGPKKHGMGRHWGEVWEQSWNYPPPGVPGRGQGDVLPQNPFCFLGISNPKMGPKGHHLGSFSGW